jgi:hypothetical protein
MLEHEKPDLIGKIKKAQEWGSTRYEIDHNLIASGYNAADIDEAWKTLKGEKEFRKRQQKILLYVSLSHISLVLALIVASFVFNFSLRNGLNYLSFFVAAAWLAYYWITTRDRKKK